jgi:hypothetical protein
VLVSGLIFHGVVGVVMKLIAGAGTMAWISIISEYGRWLGLSSAVPPSVEVPWCSSSARIVSLASAYIYICI